jgi:hypothetical protein
MFISTMTHFLDEEGNIAKSGDIDHLNPVESDHLLSGAN